MTEVWERDESGMVSRFRAGDPGSFFMSRAPRGVADLDNEVMSCRPISAGDLWAAQVGDVFCPIPQQRGSVVGVDRGSAAYRWRLTSC